MSAVLDYSAFVVGNPVNVKLADAKIDSIVGKINEKNYEGSFTLFGVLKLTGFKVNLKFTKSPAGLYCKVVANDPTRKFLSHTFSATGTSEDKCADKLKIITAWALYSIYKENKAAVGAEEDSVAELERLQLERLSLQAGEFEPRPRPKVRIHKERFVQTETVETEEFGTQLSACVKCPCGEERWIGGQFNLRKAPPSIAFEQWELLEQEDGVSKLKLISGRVLLATRDFERYALSQEDIRAIKKYNIFVVDGIGDVLDPFPFSKVDETKPHLPFTVPELLWAHSQSCCSPACTHKSLDPLQHKGCPSYSLVWRSISTFITKQEQEGYDRLLVCGPNCQFFQDVICDSHPCPKLPILDWVPSRRAH